MFNTFTWKYISNRRHIHENIVLIPKRKGGQKGLCSCECVYLCVRQKEFLSLTSAIDTWQEPPSLILHHESTVPRLCRAHHRSCQVWLPSRPSEAIYAVNLHAFNFVANWESTMNCASSWQVVWFPNQWEEEKGEKELEKSWTTNEAEVCYQPNRSSITRGWKNQGRNTQFAQFN